MAPQGSIQGQTPTNLAAPSTPEGAAVPKKATKRAAKSTAWHYFGEGNSASVGRPSQSGEWHHFGEEGAAPNGDRRGSVRTQYFSASRIVENPSRQYLTPNRTSDLEMQMWAQVNRDRSNPDYSTETKGGHAQPLRWNEKLAAVARAHSRDMIAQGFFDHVNPQGQTPAARINAAGIPWQALGENIAINGTVSGGQDAFMNEPRFQPNHRANILNTKYTDVGIGIVQARNGSYYITQDFVGTPAGTHAAGNGLGGVTQPR
jgi:uncharacterized protein YkwD